jgi:cell division protein FtsB
LSDGGHRTSTIPRPEGTRDASRPRLRPEDHGDDTRLVRRKRSRNLLAIGGVAITLAVAGSLFVLPFRAWLDQRTQLSETKAELGALQVANDRLQGENDRLQTAEGVAEAARDDLGFQQANEEAAAALPPPAVAIVLPLGWPYDDVTQILGTRTIEELRAAEAAVATTVPAPAAEPATTLPAQASVSPP